jgi:hypothetical protein
MASSAAVPESKQKESAAMNEKEMEVPQQEEVSIRTGIKAGDDNPYIGSGGGTGQVGSGGRTGQTGSGG